MRISLNFRSSGAVHTLTEVIAYNEKEEGAKCCHFLGRRP